ncbi:MAG TPA: SusC/RagA family TonB-linked outer membrane protein [Puia sp.]|nr:SusC/RagA family TonB-linked outer membrane protein [Puia sp.]
MRIAAFIITITCLHVSATAFAQKISLNEKNVPVEKIFDDISKQTHYIFFYEKNVLNGTSKVSINVKDADLQSVLSICLKDQPLIYTIAGNIVGIKKRENPAADNGVPLVTLIDITGRVVDEQNKPIASCSVYTADRKHGTSTDVQGFFKLNAVADTAVIYIKCIGYLSKHVNAEKNIGDIELKVEVNSLADVQVKTVNNGYQHILAEQETGAVSQISTKQYESQINTDFLSGLTGKLSGVAINNNIQFNGNNLFQIRGLSTITGSQNPLIVLDGYPTELTLNDINPNEIKSVTVLKDAAAAAIYGVRSSNGVVIIERKDAKEGAPQISFRTTIAITPKENYSRYRWAPSSAYIDYLKYTAANSGLIIPFQYLQSGYPFTSGQDLISKGALNPSDPNYLTQDQVNQQLASLGSYDNTKDYGRLFLKTAIAQTYNIDVSGGNKKASYYITGNYSGNRANQINNSGYSAALSGRLNINFTDRFSLKLVTDYTENITKTAPVPDISNFYPVEHFQDASGNPAPTYYNSFWNTYANKTFMALGYQDNLNYPLAEVNQENTKVHVIDNRIEADFNYKINSDFNLNFGGVYEHSHTENRYYASGQSAVVRQNINFYSTADNNGSFQSSLIPEGGYLQDNNSQLSSVTGRAQLNFSKHIGSDHFFSAIIGTEIRDRIAQGNNAGYLGYNDQTLIQLPVNYALLNATDPNYGSNYYFYLNSVSSKMVNTGTLFNQTYDEQRFVSVYGNGMYSFKNKYILTGSYRVDQSNLFGTDPKFRRKPLWSVGTAWNISKEGFMQQISWINELKFRVAEGYNGNISTVSVPEVVAISSVNPFTSSTTPSLVLSNPAYGALRWEQTYNFNLGLDWRIFKSISGSIDYYNKKSTDLIANSQIDATRGVSNASINAASMNDKGLELTLHADWITHKNFNWNTGFVFSHNTNKVVSYYLGQNFNVSGTLTDFVPSYVYTSSTYVPGYAAGAIFTYRNAGLDNTGLPLIYDKKGNKKTPASPDGGIDDLVYNGSSVPTNNIGISNRIDIGKFYFYCMVNYHGGFSVRVPHPSITVARPLKGAQNFWKKSGDENTTDILNPATITSFYYRNTIQSYTESQVYQNENTVSGSYITLSTITASYDISSLKFLKNAGFKSFQLLAQGSNLYTRAFNKYNYSLGTGGGFEKSYITPTYTIGIYTNF